ncbi:MAG: prepilin-type N-terminal cleavage/methylation domain-containing protein [candidate division WWE3 bacterium]|nr:prepilin-type N-terminal cleavage/methylation domain-containing protein [candidate division WWE3 bacterium]
MTGAQRAFTLIELLVVVGILGVVGAVAADVFVNVSRSYNKANVIAEVERNGNAALAQMTLEIKNSRVASRPNSRTLILTTASGAAVTYLFVPQTASANGYIARNGIPLTDNAFTSGVNVTGLSFSLLDATPPAVIITLTLTQPLGSPSRVDFQAGTTLKTTVSLRTYK